MTCPHDIVHCLNEYELVRKYRCGACSEVMMCACDKEIGEQFLAHQLREGCVLDTQERVPVTLGFVVGICRECRGLPREAHPKAAIMGRTSKIRRYYWRELQFEAFKRFAEPAEAQDLDPNSPYAPAAQALFSEVERAVLQDIKQRHATNPKYSYEETSQADVLARHEVEVVRFDATFVSNAEGRGTRIIDNGAAVSAEQFAANQYQRLGWQTMFVESVPFHVLFGILMYLVIQDASDPRLRLVSFGSRSDYEEGGAGIEIRTFMPSDFGTAGYAERRKDVIEEHFTHELSGDLDCLFDLWLDVSSDLREYLWAHRNEDVQRARQLIDVLPAEAVIRILGYLVGNYWAHYLGWPDLLVFKDEQFFFAEVQASKDKLSEEQKRWIADNATILGLPFKLLKIHRSGTEPDDRV